MENVVFLIWDYLCQRKPFLYFTPSFSISMKFGLSGGRREQIACHDTYVWEINLLRYNYDEKLDRTKYMRQE